MCGLQNHALSARRATSVTGHHLAPKARALAGKTPDGKSGDLRTPPVECAPWAQMAADRCLVEVRRRKADKRIEEGRLMRHRATKRIRREALELTMSGGRSMAKAGQIEGWQILRECLARVMTEWESGHGMRDDASLESTCP